MATQTIQFAFLAGQTVTVKLFADDGSDAVLATPTATEAANRTGVYTFTQTDRAAGNYLITVSATGINAEYSLPLTLNTATFWAIERSNVTYNNDKTGYSLATAPLDAAGVRAAVGLASANLDTQLGTLATASALSALVTTVGVAGAGLTEAGGTGDQLTAVPWNADWDSEVQSEVVDALNQALTESYAAAGSTASVAQMLYMIQQHLGNAAISSTTKTVKKLDGSTTAGTFTLDSATDPTTIARAT